MSGLGLAMQRFGSTPSLLGAGGAAGAGAGTFAGFGLALGAAGAAMGAIGSFYQALSERNQLRSRSSSLEHEATMSDFNARLAEDDAQEILRARRKEIALATLQHGQAKASQLARQGASGLQVGVGSSAEAQATAEWAKRVDAMTIDVNATRAANAARLRAVNLRGRSLLTRASAANLRRGAGSINPWMSAFTSLLGSGSSLGRAWAEYQNP